MARVALLSLLLLAGTTGCITGQVTKATGKWSRPKAERLTVTSTAADDKGAPYGVVALEAECRIAPGDPEGGPGATAYTLVRKPAFGPDEKRFLDREDIEPVACYGASSDPERASPPGFPDSVLVGEKGGDGKIFIRVGDKWNELPVARYLHREAGGGHPIAAGITTGLLLPITFVLDVATAPFQWFLAPWFPITPP